MATHKRPFRPTDLALVNPTLPSSSYRRSLLNSTFSKPLTNQVALRAHHSCVNALAASSDGRWLASGGDDQRGMLWKTEYTHDEAQEPRGCYSGHSSNIFTLAFSCDGSKLFSGGNDAAIMSYDLETRSSTFSTPLHAGLPPTEAYLEHDDAVMSLSAHPSNPHLLLTGSSDGTLRQYDTRTQAGCVGIIADRYAMCDVTHHPTTHEVFAYSGEDGNVGLVDGRMAWNREENVTIVRNVAVQQFDTHITRLLPDPTQPVEVRNPVKLFQRARPTVSSTVFSPSGSLFCATLSGYLPTLYELSSPIPLATFAAPPSAPRPDSPAPARPAKKKHKRNSLAREEEGTFPGGYRNTTTTKHGSFGGGPGATPGNGLYYAAGSDDFKAYVWEVPSVQRMREESQELKKEELGLGMIGYRSSLPGSHAQLNIPHSISTPSQVLAGHRSIVNTALFHPTLPLLYTAGVEKLVVCHSPLSSTPLVPSGFGSIPSTSTSTSTMGSTEQSWRFQPRRPASLASATSLPDITPRDAALDPSLLPSETHHSHELRLRNEDLEVLEYFDGLIRGEGEERVWDEEGRLETLSDNGGEGESSEDGWSEGEGESEEEGEWDMDEEEEGRVTQAFQSALEEEARGREGDEGSEDERVEAAGDRGAVRRMLNAIYAAEEAEEAEEAEDGGSSEQNEGDEDSTGEDWEGAL
ncbi:hypothetical protein JCM11641_005840 [Rhodosporidiobolus odoratus]